MLTILVPGIVQVTREGVRGSSVVTLEDVHAGDELTISYILADMPVSSRRKQLRAHYHFTCMCTKCQSDARASRKKNKKDKKNKKVKRTMPSGPIAISCNPMARLMPTLTRWQTYLWLPSLRFRFCFSCEATQAKVPLEQTRIVIIIINNNFIIIFIPSTSSEGSSTTTC